MGTTNQFTCDDCGYSASVSGGRDFGFVAVVQTMTCQNCKELVDVLIGHHGEDGPMGDPEFDKDLGLCPECDGSHVSVWDAPYPCPKCAKPMPPGKPELNWD